MGFLAAQDEGKNFFENHSGHLQGLVRRESISVLFLSQKGSWKSNMQKETFDEIEVNLIKIRNHHPKFEPLHD